jgi:hypothetical protein
MDLITINNYQVLKQYPHYFKKSSNNTQIDMMITYITTSDVKKTETETPFGAA